MLLFVRFILLLTAGLVAGASVSVLLLEHAFGGSAAFYTEFKQLEIRAFTGPLTAIGAVALISGLVHAALVRPSRQALVLTLAGVISSAIGGAITAGVHFPMNDRVVMWSAASPPGEWTDVRDRWRQAHDLRTVVTMAAFSCFLLGTVSSKREL